LGCLPSLSDVPARDQRTLDSALNETFSWINKNKNEFVIIYFDNEADDGNWNSGGELVSLISKYISIDEIFTPNDFILYENSFPTPQQMIDDYKKHVLFVSSTDYGTSMSSIIFARGTHICNWYEPHSFDDFSQFPSCFWDDYAPYSDVFLRITTSEIQYGIMDSGFKLGYDDEVLNVTTLPPIVSCNTPLIGCDNLTPEKSSSMIWSFERNEPSNKNECFIISSKTNKWMSSKCDENYYLSCQNITNQFDWKLNLNNCDNGYVYSYPINGYSNLILTNEMIKNNINYAYLNIKFF